jgi:hypothetical protein
VKKTLLLTVFLLAISTLFSAGASSANTGGRTTTVVHTDSTCFVCTCDNNGQNCQCRQVSKSICGWPT